jgi:protein-tyrosine phosphatase
MAEVIFRAELQRRGCEGIEVASSGTWGIDGSPATPEAISAVGALDIDLREHRARSLSAEELQEADLVIAMTSVHRREIAELVPEAADKTLLLKQLKETSVRDSPPGAPGVERLAALIAGERPASIRAHDVDDPMGMPLRSYERTVTELSEGIERLADLLCGPAATA